MVVGWLLAAALIMGGLAPFQPVLAQAGGGSGSALEDVIKQNQATGEGAGMAQQGVNTDLRIIVAKIIKQFMSLLGTIAVILIIYAGYLWMTASGNEEQISKAKKIILNATIGLIIIMMAWTIAAFVVDRVTWSVSGAPAQDAYWLW